MLRGSLPVLALSRDDRALLRRTGSGDSVDRFFARLETVGTDPRAVAGLNGQEADFAALGAQKLSGPVEDMAKLAEPLMKDGGTLSTMTYYGSQMVVEHYNMMGPVKAALTDAGLKPADQFPHRRRFLNIATRGQARRIRPRGVGWLPVVAGRRARRLGRSAVPAVPGRAVDPHLRAGGNLLDPASLLYHLRLEGRVLNMPPCATV